MVYTIGCNELFDGSFQSTTIEELIKWLSDKKSIAVDTETEGFMDFSNRVIMLQIGDYNDQFVIDTRSTDIRSLKPFFEDKNLLKLFWNAKFDVNFLRFTFGWQTKGIHDCFLAECLLTAGHTERELGLGANALRYCSIKLNKDTRNKFVGLYGANFTDMQIQYGADDVKYLHMIKEKQDIEITKWEINNVLELENETVLVLADIEYNGMLLDSQKWLEVATLTTKNSLLKEQELDKLVLADSRLTRYHAIQQDMFSDSPRLSINYGSSTQTLKILKTLGLPVESTNERELLKYAKSNLFVKTLIEYKKQCKLSDAFGKDFLKFVNPKTHRIHQSLWPILNTGRMSSSEPNLTQIPSKGNLGKSIRSAFIAGEGKKIVGGDYAGCELRFIAEYSQDPMWLEAFREDKDLHSELACKVFNIPMEDVRKPTPFKPDITYRDVQKTVSFGYDKKQGRNKTCQSR